ncbi:3-keto-disaccharide hydrolase [Candidatus Seribacter sulfatis]|uniref:3-keto-disaccharide hydrolase n=1 Tax=Candidatus Seribacter sulfatis TaxID=3381756 RepID=UPI00389A8F90
MKFCFLVLFPFVTSLFLSPLGAEKSKHKWVNLFNGKDLSGWHNPYSHGEFKVVKGVIELIANKKFFLAYDQKFSDFILEAEIKLPEGKANSGFLFRSQKRENGSMFGYQAEVDGSDRNWSGGLYDEGRRGWIHPKKPIVNPYNDEHWKKDRSGAFKRSDWNHYKIRCLGEHIQIWVNGVKTTDLKDSTDAKGFIAIQHHGEKGQVYRFKNIKILEL